MRVTGLQGRAGGRAQEPVLHPPRRLHRRVHGPAREADRRADRLLQRQLRHPAAGAARRCCAGATRARRASTTGSSAQTELLRRGPLLRLEPHVRARPAAAGQEDELDRDHRADLGADLRRTT